MTVKELKEILDTFPDNMNIRVSCDRFVRDIKKVSTIVDMDTNIVSVDIIAEDKAIVTLLEICGNCDNYGWGMTQCMECNSTNNFKYFVRKYSDE